MVGPIKTSQIILFGLAYRLKPDAKFALNHHHPHPHILKSQILVCKPNSNKRNMKKKLWLNLLELELGASLPSHLTIVVPSLICFQ